MLRGKCMKASVSSLLDVLTEEAMCLQNPVFCAEMLYIKHESNFLIHQLNSWVLLSCSRLLCLYKTNKIDGMYHKASGLKRD